MLFAPFFLNVGSGGGGGTWSPLDLGDKLTLWRAGDQGVTLSSDRVSQHADLSGKDHHYAQADAGRQPVVGTLNGLPAISYDGTDNLDSGLSASEFLSASGSELLFVVEANSVVAPTSAVFESPLWTDASGFNMVTWSTSGIRATRYDGVSRVTGYVTAPTGTPLLVHVSYASGTLSCQVGDSEPATVAVSSLANLTGVVYEARNYNGSVRFNGLIGEVIVCNDAFSDEEREAVRAYLANRWGVAA